MSVAIEKQKRSSERYALVSITGKRNVLTDLTLKSGNVYSADLSGFFVSSVKYNGTTYNAVATENPAANEFYFDGSTFEINLASLTGSVIVYFKKFYTSEKFRYADVTNHLGQTVKVEYEPKLIDVPKNQQSIKNIFSGIISFQQFNIALDDSDLALRKLNNANTSFNQGRVELKRYINGVFVELSVGKITRISFPESSKVFFTVKDDFEPLNNEATFGDSSFHSTANIIKHANLDPSKRGFAIPYFIGKNSLNSKPATVGLEDVTNPNFIAYPELSNAFEGINIDYLDNPPYATTKNREFILGRVGPEGLASQSFGTGASISHPLNSTSFTITGGTGFNIKIADNVWGVATSGASYIATCVSVNDNIAKFECYDGFGAQKVPTVANDQLTIGNIVLSKSIQLSVRFGGGVSFNNSQTTIPLTPDRDFLIFEDVLPSGNKLVRIKLQENFGFLSGSFYGGFALSQPDQGVNFTMQSLENSDHSYFMKRLLAGAGISYVDANIDAAQADLDVPVVCQIPEKDATTFPKYLEVAESIVRSTIGFLYFDINGEIQYKLTKEIAATSETIGDSETNDRSLNVNVDYEDLYTSVNFHSKFFSNTDSISYYPAERGTSLSEENEEAKNLQEIDRSYRIEHCLEFLNDTIVGRWLSLVSSSRETYNFVVPTQLIDQTINNDVTLDSAFIIGGPSQADMKIISLNKSDKNIKVKATTLGGFSNS